MAGSRGRGGRVARAGRTRRRPSPEWQVFQATLFHPDQIAYEEIRPVVVLGQEIKARAAEVGVAPHTLARRVERFVQHSIPGLVDSSPHKLGDKRRLPQLVRDYILELMAEHPPFTPREIVGIVEVRFDRMVSHHTVRHIIAQGPLPKLSRRRFPYYRQLRTKAARRAAILRLHLDGWSPSTIVAYLRAPRTTVYDFLKRWAKDAVVKPLGDKKRGRPLGGKKATMEAVAAIKELQEESAIGEFRMAAALKQHYDIELSPRTCGRIMARNRDLYRLPAPAETPDKPRKPMPYATNIPHRWWSVDLRYMEKHHIPGISGPVYIWTILDNASRQIVASAPSKSQTLWDYLLVLFTAIHVHGAPIGLISDGGSVFKANVALELYQRLGIEKKRIQPGQPWQNYVESSFNIMKHMEAYKLGQATGWEQFCAVHARFIVDYNHQMHFAHQNRADGLRTPAEVLGGSKGRLVPGPTMQDIFDLLMAERRVRPSGYIRYQNWHIYGQEGLQGEHAAVLLMKETLSITYSSQIIAQYAVTTTPTGHGRRIIEAAEERFTVPALTPTPQAPLWDEATWDEIEWRKVYRAQPYAPRRRKLIPSCIQAPYLAT
jgi:putative transposase